MSSQFQRIELYPPHTSHCLYGVMLFIILTGPKCLFPFCKGWNVCVLESFQLFDELSCIQNCDKRNLKHANWLTVALICCCFFLLIILQIIYIRMFPFCLVWDFCMHFNSCFSSAWYSISIRAIIILTAILPGSPFVHVLNHSWMHLFCEKEIFVLFCY